MFAVCPQSSAPPPRSGGNFQPASLGLQSGHARQAAALPQQGRSHAGHVAARVIATDDDSGVWGGCRHCVGPRGPMRCHANGFSGLQPKARPSAYHWPTNLASKKDCLVMLAGTCRRGAGWKLKHGAGTEPGAAHIMPCNALQLQFFPPALPELRAAFSRTWVPLTPLTFQNQALAQCFLLTFCFRASHVARRRTNRFWSRPQAQEVGEVRLHSHATPFNVLIFCCY